MSDLTPKQQQLLALLEQQPEMLDGMIYKLEARVKSKTSDSLMLAFGKAAREDKSIQEVAEIITELHADYPTSPYHKLLALPFAKLASMFLRERNRVANKSIKRTKRNKNQNRDLDRDLDMELATVQNVSYDY